MTRIVWDKFGSRHYETGVDRGVLYPAVGPGVPWNGLTSIQEVESDTSTGKIVYIDGNRYATELGLGTYAAVVSALTYPQEFEAYDGYNDYGFSNQKRKSFGFSYRTMLGDDRKDIRRGYKIHLVYNALATPSSLSHTALGGSMNPAEFSWGFSTTPVVLEDARATSHFIIDTTKAYPESVTAIEDILYGDNLNAPRLPSMSEILTLFESFAIFKVIPHGDGTVTVIGPDDAVDEIAPNLWSLDWPSVVRLDEEKIHLSSL